jgi:eukaryotic-like serine/threonine-protein kinase
MSAPLHTEKTIFLEAAEIASPTERAAFLERSCGDDRQLRAAVEALLLSHERSQHVLDATTNPLAEHTGTIIGPYKLLEQIGEGGMGTVFMAEQTHLYNARLPSRSSSRAWIAARSSPVSRPSGKPWR